MRGQVGSSQLSLYVKILGVVATFLVLVLPLAGCGSSAPAPPFSVSCTTHRLPGGTIRAAVTVTNSTSATAGAIIYGPALYFLQQIHPLLNPQQVVIKLPNHAQSIAYFGYTVPRVSPNKPMHVTLVFRNPPNPKSVAISTAATVQAQDLTVAENPDCTIG